MEDEKQRILEWTKKIHQEKIRPTMEEIKNILEVKKHDR
jgi:hypothetical protein